MFKNPFSFEGRIRRTEYGLSCIIFVVARVILTLIAAAIILNSENSDNIGVVILGILFSIPLLWFLWAQGAKRCHDLGNSGWWQLIPFYTLWLLFQDGQPGQNQHGDNPKGIQVVGGQPYQGVQTNQGVQNSNIDGYNGGYNGGHNGGYNGGYNVGSNNPINYSSTQNQSNNNEYRDGDLYK